MKLTKKNKAIIDCKDYYTLLRSWRFDSLDSEWFQGETGKYWLERMGELKNQIGIQAHVEISKKIGWDKFG